MKILKKIRWRALNLTSAFALMAAFSILGQFCRTWMYQPEVPKQLLDDNID